MSGEFYNNPKLMVNNGSIVIYYYRENLCRYPTGFSVSKTKNKYGKFIEWDYKTVNTRQSNPLAPEQCDPLSNLSKNGLIEA